MIFGQITKSEYLEYLNMEEDSLDLTCEIPLCKNETNVIAVFREVGDNVELNICNTHVQPLIDASKRGFVLLFSIHKFIDDTKKETKK